jgi:hypothetical protein
MTISIKYRSHTHDVGEVVLSVNRQTLLTDARTAYAETVQIQLDGYLVGDGVASIDTKLAALSNAYAIDGGDFIVTDDAAGELELSLRSRETLGGIRVVKKPTLPPMQNAAYVTFLAYQVVLEAIVPKSSPSTLLRSYSEQISFSGGGWRRGCLQTRVGLPQSQLFTRNQIFRAVQTGRAVGLYSYPTMPSPIWPAWLVEQYPEKTYVAGRPVGEGSAATYMDFGIQWRYVFESPVPLVGVPRTWGT